MPLRVTVLGGGPEDGVGLLDQLPNGAGPFRAFRWPAGDAPAAVEVTPTPGGARLSVSASSLPCGVSTP